MKETWSDIEGYKGYYKVSNLRSSKEHSSKWNNKGRKNLKTKYSKRL